MWCSSKIAVYNRNIEKEKEETIHIQSDHIGIVGGKRVTCNNVLVKGISGIETSFGYTTIYRFVVNNKDFLTWFSSKDIGLKEGEYVNELTFSVKKHDVYKEKNITIITRAKIK